MTRKHHVLIAVALRLARSGALSAPNPGSYLKGCDACATSIAHALTRDNPSGFDPQRFLSDAGVKAP